MNTVMVRLVAVATVGGIAVGGILLGGGAADAMPSDTPCGASDVTVTITPDTGRAAGHEAYDIIYTAAAPTTNCKLQGAPTALSFIADGTMLANVEVTRDSTTDPVPVNLRAGHPAVSRIIQRADEAPQPITPTTVTMDLPTGPYGEPVVVDWPAGAPLKGTTVKVTDVSTDDN